MKNVGKNCGDKNKFKRQEEVRKQNAEITNISGESDIHIRPCI